MPSDPLPAHDLAAFVAAVELASIHEAANALSLTQSGVTKRVQALERRLGVVLLERGRFGVRPTAAGRALHRPARRALRALSEAERAALEQMEDEDGRLPIAASHTIGEFLLPRWLAQFTSAPGPVHPQVEIVHSPGVVALVRAGRAQVGFVEHDEPVEELSALTLWRDELVVVVAPDHPWAGGEAVEVEALATEPYLTREEGSGTRSVAQRRLALSGVTLRPTYEAASTQSLKRAVLSGGFTLISRLTVGQEQQLGALRVLPVEGVDLGRELRAIRDPETTEGAGARFWRWLERHVAARRPPNPRAPIASR